jgi:GDPmannose 4,6-dehydratase
MACVVVFLAQVELLIGNPAKAEKLLGWKPKIKFAGLVEDMMKADVALVEKGDMIN